MRCELRVGEAGKGRQSPAQCLRTISLLACMTDTSAVSEVNAAATASAATTPTGLQVMIRGQLSVLSACAIGASPHSHVCYFLT